MRIAFYELAPELRVGGLETAVRGLEAALRAANPKSEIRNPKEEGWGGTGSAKSEIRNPKSEMAEEEEAEARHPRLPHAETQRAQRGPAEPEIRNPKSEIQNEEGRGPGAGSAKSEIRNPKSEMAEGRGPGARSAKSEMAEGLGGAGGAANGGMGERENGGEGESAKRHSAGSGSPRRIGEEEQDDRGARGLGQGGGGADEWVNRRIGESAGEFPARLATSGEALTVLRNPDPATLRPGDVAHFHGLWSVAHWRIARELRRRGIPYVTSPHGMLEPWAIREKRWKKLPYLRLIEGAKLRGGKILATAEQEAERIRQRLGPNADVEVISLGTDMRVGPDYERAREKLGWAPQERVMLYLSRIHKKKGLLQLLRTLGRLEARSAKSEIRNPKSEREDGCAANGGMGESGNGRIGESATPDTPAKPGDTRHSAQLATLREADDSRHSAKPALLKDARLVIVGDGDAAYVNACREAAAALHGKMRIDWHEPVWSDEKWSYLQGADLMCLPTFSENFGMVVLEACQVGTPVLTTVETPWKSIEDAGLGWVGPATEDYYEAALREFLQGEREIDRTELATWARERFSWDALVDQYIALYRRSRAASPQIRNPKS